MQSSVVSGTNQFRRVRALVRSMGKCEWSVNAGTIRSSRNNLCPVAEVAGLPTDVATLVIRTGKQMGFSQKEVVAVINAADSYVLRGDNPRWRHILLRAARRKA